MPPREPLPTPFAGRAFSVGAAREAGVSPGRLRGRDLDRPFHGVRSPAGSGATVLERCVALNQRMQPGQFFSHSTAAALWGVPLGSAHTAEAPLHVTALSPVRPPRCRGVVGHEMLPGTAASVMRFGLPVANPALTWLQLAASFDLGDLVAAGDHLVLDPYLFDPHDPRPFTSITELGALLERHRSPGIRAARSALGRIRAGAESRPETLLRLLLVDAGLPEPEVNITLHQADGRFLARVDLVYPAWHVGVEYDGEQHRESTRQYDTDMYRREQLTVAGWDIVYVRSRGLFVTPGDTVRRVRAALERAGWRG